MYTIHKMPQQVYKIWIYPGQDNKYGVNRTETWILRRDKVFPTIEEAKKYIIEKSIKTIPEMTNMSINMSKEELPQFYEEFLFTGNKYLRYRQYTLSVKAAEQIISALKNDGINVVKI